MQKVKANGATTLKVLPYQWAQVNKIMNTQPNDLFASINEANHNNFIQRWVTQKNGKFDEEMNKFWIYQYCYYLSTTLNLEQQTSILAFAQSTLESRLEKFQIAHRDACIKLIADQKKMSSSKSKKQSMDVFTFLSIDFGPDSEY